MKLPVHIGLSVTGLVAYGLACILVSLVHYALTDTDLPFLAYLAAIAAMIGWDGHTLAYGRVSTVCLRQGITVVAALVVLLWPGIIGMPY